MLHELQFMLRLPVSIQKCHFPPQHALTADRRPCCFSAPHFHVRYQNQGTQVSGPSAAGFLQLTLPTDATAGGMRRFYMNVYDWRGTLHVSVQTEQLVEGRYNEKGGRLVRLLRRRVSEVIHEV